MNVNKILLLLMMLLTLLLTGCWDSKELSGLTITVCIGIDKVEGGYMITQQVLNAKAIASKKSVNEPAVILYKEKGKDILEIFRRMTEQVGRKIYTAHMKIVVLGESVAKDNITDIVDLLARDHEFRTDFGFVVAKDTTAYNVLSTLTQLNSISGIELDESIQVSEKYWAPSKNTRIIELLNDMISDGKEPVMTGVEVTGGQNETNNVDALKSTDVKNRLKISGLCVFKDNKFKGWLNEDESKGFNYITGNVKNTVGYAEGFESQISFEVIKAESKISAKKQNGKLAIGVDINIEENVGTSDANMDVSKKENMQKLSEMSEKKVNEQCVKALKKIQEEFKSDAFGFGEVVHRKYPKEWKKLKNDWNDVFATLPVNFNIKVKTNRMGQIGKSVFIKEKD